MLPFPVFVTLLSRRFLDFPKSLQVFSATFATPALKSPLRQSSQLYGPTDQPTRFPLFPHAANMAHTRKPASPSPSIVYSTLLCIPGKMDAAAPTPSRRRPLLLPSAARRPLITPLNAMLTKNKGCASPHPQQSPPNFQPATTRTRPFLFSCSTLDCRSKIPVRSGLSTSFAELFLSRAAITVSPLSATFTENQGAPPNFAPPPSSPLTTHYSLPQSFRYTMRSREP